MNYWLMKSEPSTFGIDHLAKAKNRTTGWDGVRNFQARNYLRSMRKGDLALFYHSSCEIPGVAGIVKVVREGYPDMTAFDPKDHHYDPGSKADAPRWYAVDVKLEHRFGRIIALDELRKYEKSKLKDMVVLRRGNRLSITPLTQSEFEFVRSLE